MESNTIPPLTQIRIKQGFKRLLNDFLVILLALGFYALFLVLGALLFRKTEERADELQKLQARAVYDRVRVTLNKTRDYIKLIQYPGTTIHSKESLDNALDCLHWTYAQALEHGYTGKQDEKAQLPVRWGFHGSVLFAFTTATAIGFGHTAPITSLGQILVVFFAIFGIPLTLVVFKNLGKTFHRWFKLCYFHILLRGVQFVGLKYTELVCEKLERRSSIYNCSVPKKKISAAARKVEDVAVPFKFYIGLFALVIFTTGLFFKHTLNLTMIEACYFGWITLSTIGFGDIVPAKDKFHTVEGKVILINTMVTLVIGLSLVGMMVDYLKMVGPNTLDSLSSGKKPGEYQKWSRRLEREKRKKQERWVRNSGADPETAEERRCRLNHDFDWDEPLAWRGPVERVFIHGQPESMKDGGPAEGEEEKNK